MSAGACAKKILNCEPPAAWAEFEVWFDALESFLSSGVIFTDDQLTQFGKADAVLGAAIRSASRAYVRNLAAVAAAQPDAEEFKKLLAELKKLAGPPNAP